MFSSGFVRADSLRSRDGEVLLGVGLPWMRSLPFRSIGAMSLAVDGDDVAELCLEVGGRRHPISDLSGLGEEFWFIQDRYLLIGRPAAPAEPGRHVQIVASATMTLPYLLPGGYPMPVQQTVRRELTVQPAAES